jgi:hypothetical protein
MHHLFDERMTFGTYKGWLVSDLTDSHLVWLTEKCTYLNHPRNKQLKIAIQDEIERRIVKRIPPSVKARLLSRLDSYFSHWWLDQGGTWYRIGWPDFPSDQPCEIPSWEFQHSLEYHHYRQIEERERDKYRRTFGHGPRTKSLPEYVAY